MATRKKYTKKKERSPRVVTLLRYVGANVRRLREIRGWTQTALGDASGHIKRYIQLPETGEANLTVRSLIDIADALGVAPDDLFAAAKFEEDLPPPKK